MLTVVRLGLTVRVKRTVIIKDGRIQPKDQRSLHVLGVPLHPHPHHQLYHPVDHEQCPVWAGELNRICK